MVERRKPLKKNKNPGFERFLDLCAHQSSRNARWLIDFCGHKLELQPPTRPEIRKGETDDHKSGLLGKNS